MKATERLRRFVLANSDAIGADEAMKELTHLEASLSELRNLTSPSGDFADMAVNDYLVHVVGVEQGQDMPTDMEILRGHVLVLDNLKEAFDRGAITPVHYAGERGSLIRGAVHVLGRVYGLDFAPAFIDTMGYVILSVVDQKPFGKPMAQLLNQYQVRTGFGDVLISPSNNWCYIHHFDIEKLLRQVALEGLNG